jgi:hypothetical protein
VNKPDFGDRATDQWFLKLEVIVILVVFAIIACFEWVFGNRSRVDGTATFFLLLGLGAVLRYFDSGNERMERKLDAILKTVEAFEERN